MTGFERIIFLDIDGVLNTDINMGIQKEKGNPTSANYIKLPEDKIFRLYRIVNATKATLIMSSSWRIGATPYGPSPAYLNVQNQLNRYGMYLSGWTPIFYNNRDRGREIYLWLKQFRRMKGYTPPYIIIDNEIDQLVRGHKGHIITTNSKFGLTDKLVNISINVLLNQYPKFEG